MGRKDLHNVGYPYIRITFSDVSLVWRYDENRPDYFSSLNHKRYVDKANTCEISISYVPKPNEDPNLIEAAIVKSNGQCKFQYGMLGKLSKEYTGAVYTYGVTLDNGVLRYNFKLVSEVTTTNNQTVSYNFAFEDTSNYQKIGANSGLGFLTRLYGWISDNKLFKNDEGKQLYQIDIEGSDKDFKIPTDGISGSRMSPMAAIKDIASKFVSTSNNTDDKFDAIVIDNTDYTQKLIRIVKRGSAKGPTFTFDWNSKDSDVLHWDFSFDGSVALFYQRGIMSPYEDKSLLVRNDQDQGGYTITTIKYPSLNKENVTSFFSEQRNYGSQSLSNLDWFYERSNYTYKATLETIGITDDIELVRSVVTVNPFIGGRLHHSAGRYLVIGITDSVSSSGFNTTLDLVRKPDESEEIYKHGDESNSTKDYTADKIKNPRKPYIPRKQWGLIQEMIE